MPKAKQQQVSSFDATMFSKIAEEDFQVISERMPGIVCVYDVTTGEYLYANPALRKILGYAPEEFLRGGLEFATKLVHPDDLSKIMTENQSALAAANTSPHPDALDEPIVNFEYRMRHKDGHYVWLHTDGSVFSRKNGQVDRVMNMSIDISARKHIEEELTKSHSDISLRKDIEAKLRASEERYQAFIHNSTEGIWRYELEKPIPIDLPADKQIKLMYKYGYLAEANETMAKMYGLNSPKELVGSRLGDLVVETEPQNIAYLKACIDSGYNLRNTESQEVDSDGNTKYFLNSLVGIVENGALRTAWGTQLDITEHHQTTEALRASEARLGLALQASQLGMWEWNVSTGELTWSEQLRKIFGVKPAQLITYELYISLLHPDDTPFIQHTIQDSMKSGKKYEVEHRIIWPDGSIHWVLSRGQAFMEDDIAASMIGTCMGIDDRKATEDLKVRNALLDAERTELIKLNASKDEFIALASHQLRTPATGVKQFLGMLLDGFAGDLALTEQQLHMLQTAYDSNERQIRIVNDLLLIATIDAGKVQLHTDPIDMCDLLQEIVGDHAAAYAAKQQTLTLKPARQCPIVPVDAERIRMAIENLLENASKYSPAGTDISVSIATKKTGVAIAIKDQGVGIAKKDLPKLFQKFTRIPNELSTSAGGTGLGLYWAEKVIVLHGGKLGVASQPGMGTTFTITLPFSNPAS